MSGDARVGSFDDDPFVPPGIDATIPTPVLGPLSNADQRDAPSPPAETHGRNGVVRRWMLASLLVAAVIFAAAVVYRTSAVDDRKHADSALASSRAQLDQAHRGRDATAARRDANSARLKAAGVANAASRAAAARVAAHAAAARAAAATVLVSSRAESQLSTVQELSLRAGRFTDYNRSRALYNATYGASDGPYAQQIAALQRLIRALSP